MFFDLQKAFDSILHRELVEGLYQLNISPVHFVDKRYLIARHQKAVVGGGES